jgi:hypothetical protein
VSTIENEGDDEVPDDAEKELPGDQEYSAKGDTSQEDDDESADNEPIERSKAPNEADLKAAGQTKKMKKQEIISQAVNVGCIINSV